jgi:senataxin
MILSRQTNPDEKIFVWAPSNAAVDEIVCRLVRKGLISFSGKKKEAKVIRVGVLDYNPPELVKQYSLDTLVEEKMKKSSFVEEVKKMEKMQNHVTRLDVIREKINIAAKKRDDFEEFSKNKDNQEILKKLYRLLGTQLKEEFKSTTLYDRRLAWIDEAKIRLEKQLKEFRSRNANPTNRRFLLEKELLNNAKIIWTTLSMAGIDKIEKLEQTYSHLIVDEACQATEISSLIPLIHSPDKIILVGDQNQLPATCFAPNSIETNYSKSLYERLLNQGIPQIMLKTQYRMHPEIREFPSSQFYNNE